ncbi:cyclic beta 1-2 glucan synthetase [Janthinobacterium sp. Marseille]|nr:glucoamylase family protein [Janthinobacterium sp. Marseille]ABR89681.1 cyclic beta 1-2 glucan synthetase [Janthinobacterium sp. Marseille]
MFKKLLNRNLGFSFAEDASSPTEEPVRVEIFSAERLESHAAHLAAIQKIGTASGGASLVTAARENGKIVTAAHAAIEHATGERRAITSAAEWLLDNLHVIDENVASVVEGLPRRLYKALPKLVGGNHAGQVRIYALCWEFAAHTDNHFDADVFLRFVRSYQTVQRLTMAELWALPVVMRVVLLEHLRRVAVRVVKAQAARQAADDFANDLIVIAQKMPENEQPGIVLPPGRLLQPFVVQLVQRLRYQQPGFTPLLDALGARLLDQGPTIDDIVLREHTTQVASNQTIRNIITSMRTIAAYDWRDFFESVSLVEQKLQTLSSYAELDFLTRDRYRKIIQQIALNARYSEQQIADALVRKIESHRSQMSADDVVADERALDPGYYLLGRGRSDLEAELGYKPHLTQKLRRHYIAHASLYYPLTILSVAVLILAFPLWTTHDKGVPTALLAVLIIAGLFPAVDIAVAFVNKVLMRLFWPRHLPRVELADISENMRTFVAVPIMLTSEEGIEEEIQQLETHYLSNPDGEVYFTLLSDWADAKQEHMPQDLPLLEKARRCVAMLNTRYGPSKSGQTRFYILHRRRLWNEAEGKWMGWERKRGKLHEFNRLLRDAQDTSFLLDDIPVPRNVRYVITLDADTRLPIGALRALVGVAVHPLNQPRHDPETMQVIEGYGILQPRITPTLPMQQERTLYRRFFSARGGVDPYGGAVSDVYQDVFGWGSYSGKGLYDVDAFERALSGKVPENTMLSHDLFEGALARCALVNDVELFEDFPSHVEEAAARQHRWTRGDWQLLPWLLNAGRVSMSMIDRLKIADNMRRSLTAPAILLTLAAAFFLGNAPAWPWLILAIVGLAPPAVFRFFSDLLPHRDDLSFKAHWRRGMAVLPDTIAVVFISLAVLAQYSWLMLDAIVRTLVRLIFTRKKLLEWVTSAQVRRAKKYSLGSFLWRGRMGMLIALVIVVAVALLHPAALWLAIPFCLLWFCSPLIARAISLPPVDTNVEELDVAEETELRLVARRTWRFFTTFVVAQDNYLPPDNFQEDPQPVIAHRTSPTNFGLYLLSVVSARDFGWIGLSEMMRRLDATMGTLHKLPRYHGHFYNWYETERLEVLSPRYISTVDSGNLAGHLFALAQACKDAREQSILRPTIVAGMRDTVLLLRLAIDGIGPELRTQAVSINELRKGTEQFSDFLLKTNAVSPAYAFWEKMVERSENLFDLAQAFSVEIKSPDNEVLTWANELRAAVRMHCNDFVVMMPWVHLEAQDGGNNAELWKIVNSHINIHVALEDLPPAYAAAQRDIARLFTSQNRLDPDVIPQQLFDALDGALMQAAVLAVEWLDRLESMERATRAMALEMDFSFLMSPERQLFSIGYNADEGKLDDSYYDLLASEARLASLVAIAERQAPPSHWFRLGRRMLPGINGPVLASWSGSMFEYLMPSLVISTPRGSMLDQTCRDIVARQIEYGKERHVPWGVSESALNLRDRAFTYQYSAFGVPGLGLKRGLEKDIVIAPYATGLAAMYMPKSAVANFRSLTEIGALGRYGFYEALDFTPGRRAENQTMAIVRAYMAHHQGMLLVALGNVINRNVMRHRFHHEPIIRSAELLLHESQPRWVQPASLALREERERPTVVMPESGVAREFNSAMTATPETQLLSNGHYAVMMTAAGSGYSLWNKLGITRWREDATRDHWGSHIYLRDSESGAYWSAGFQPTAVEPDSYQVKFAEDRVRISRADGSISSMLEVIVSPEDDTELRRLTLTNNGSRTRYIEVTSYMEVLLAPVAADIAHPAFSNLFVETEYLHEIRGLLASRRPRKDGEARPWAAHVVARGEGSDSAVGIEYETDRARFIGRGQGVSNPLSIIDGRPLSNTVGAVLDPIFSLRVRVRLEPNEIVHLVFSTMAANSREEILSLADKYHDGSAFSRISALVWTHAQVQLHYLRVEHYEAELFQHLASRILFSDRTARASGRVIRSMRLSHAGLWGQGISGDRPIVLLRMAKQEDLRLVSQLLRAHEYWRMKQLPVDLVILNEKGASYAQELQAAMEGMVRAAQAFSAQQEQAERGGAFIVRADVITDDERTLLLASARVVLEGGQGSLAEQLQARPEVEENPPFSWLKREMQGPRAGPPSVPPQLALFNGLGGFDKDGREYVIVLGQDQVTPAPWINVIANPTFGFTVSERGAGYTWSQNSRENKLTPWSNDPVSDPSGEAFYIRDEESGALWSPTISPIRVPEAIYTTRHGQGYSRFELNCSGIASELLQFVSWDDPVKICRLRLKNVSRGVRRLSLSSYVEWALGASRADNMPFIATERDADTGAMFARNPWNIEFGQRVAFIDLCGKQTAWTGDRKEFIGRNGNFQKPEALTHGSVLSNRVGAGFDPCGVLQTLVEIAPDSEVEIVFLMGQADDAEAARSLVQRYRAADINEVFETSQRNWHNILHKVQVETPDRSMDYLLNGWLLYQTLSCRFWARTAFYQAGGAYGFRDQLQDTQALALVAPTLAREQILRASSRQFPEGDVQHWWHPPSGRGVRTHISDDLIWLPYCAAHYVDVTGDAQIYDEMLPFLEGDPLPLEKEDAYFEAHISEQMASVYEHCARALDHSLHTGPHGLPLMGGGDWNDGMNRVGHGGKGESVWLAWFLYATLLRFAPVAEARKDKARATRWRKHAEKLKKATEQHAWDGAWYRRAYFDDGTPLGSASNAECRIDSIAQSWSVISGAGEPERSQRAMESVDQYLIRPGDDLILLFTPPFDKTPLDPGYIKGYLPGVRENGGQYTHAAVWCLIAYSKMGKGGQAHDLFKMINPANRSSSRTGMAAYKVEPYAVAADIYAESPHVRRGGWTWYTGAAGWLYRAGVESILGLCIQADKLSLDPCLPNEWRSAKLHYRYGAAVYNITILNPTGISKGVLRVELDGVVMPDHFVTMRDDGATHTVTVLMGTPVLPAA